MPRAKAITPTIYLQAGGQSVDVASLTEKAKEAYVEAGNKVSSIKNVELYLKHEDGKAYYVINGDFTGDMNLF